MTDQTTTTHASGPGAGPVVDDVARRREWVAALRYADDSDNVTDGWTSLANLADRIESGDLTPWADQPEPAAQPDEPAGRRLMDIGEFRREGYLQEVNRQFFHPLGLALAVNVADGTERLSGVWDDRDDPEGIRYAPGVIDPEKAARVVEAQRRMADSRLTVLGYVVQPVDAEPSGAAPAAAGPHPGTPVRAAGADGAEQPCSDPYCGCCYPFGVHPALAPQADLDREPVTPTEPAAGLELAAEKLLDLIDDLHDPDPCWYDHHGYCQAHGWMDTEPECPHARAQRILAKRTAGSPQPAGEEGGDHAE